MSIEMSSSCAATDLRSAILHKRFAKARRILRKEGYWQEKFNDDFEAAWKSVLAHMSATKMELVPTDKADVQTRREYLVRIGSVVFVACASDLDGELTFFHEHDHFTIAEADELLEVRLT